MTRGELGRSPDRRRLDLALQAAGLGEFEWDIARDVFMVSDRMAAITGVPAGERPAEGGLVMDAFVHPEDLAELTRRRADDIAARDSFDVEFRHIRPDDGRVICVRSAGIIARDNEARPISITGIVQDVTAKRQEEDQRQELMAELDHRVKNVLATVQSLATQTAKRTTSLQAFLSNFGGRLKAMASANELLTAARWRGAAVEHQAGAVLKALAPGQTRLEGPEVFLTPRAANALSLALHELAANAVKFGALSTEAGQVDVRWARTPEGGFELNWTESGGPSVTPPRRQGFGTTLLEQVTGRELNGEVSIEYPPAGGAAGHRPTARDSARGPGPGGGDRDHHVGGQQPEGFAGADRGGRRATGPGAGDRPHRGGRRGGRAGL